jgi:hypothetical protein
MAAARGPLVICLKEWDGTQCCHVIELPRGLGSFVVGLIICSTSISRHTQQANHFLDEQEAGMQVVVVVVVKTLLCHNSS